MIQQTSIFSYLEELKNGNIGKLQSEVLDIIRDHAPIDSRDIAKMLGKDTTTIGPRVFELREKGLVVEDCRKLNSTTNKTTIHWKIRQ